MLDPSGGLPANVLDPRKRKPSLDDLDGLLSEDDAAFSEGDHPRDASGKFGSGGGKASGKTSPAAHVEAIKRAAGETKAFLEGKTAGEVLRAVAGSEKVKEGLSFALQSLLSHATGLDASTWGLNEQLIDHVVHDFGAIAEITAVQAKDVMRSALKGMLAMRKGGNDEAEGDGVSAVLEALLELLSEENDDDGQAQDEAKLKPIAAGIVLCDPDGKVLFLKRGPEEKNFADHWCLPGGGCDTGETAEAAAMRECIEETGYTPTDLTPIYRSETGDGRGYFETFLCRVGSQFAPSLADSEHVAYAWSLPTDAPRPLHPGVEKMVRRMKDKFFKFSDASQIALDADSVRDKDRDGRLRISVANISKATVNPYKGSEIPDWEKLGLDPDKVYNLYRDPDELQKAADTFNGVQILRKHVPVNAEDHQPYDVIGATGTDARFEPPYLRNSLVFWAGDDIEDIEDDVKRELSCGYHYRAEMTPGEVGDMRYDGVMRDIHGNHVALVKDGRAGPDVVVGDSNEEIEAMTNRELARKIAAVAGRTVSVQALSLYMKPRLALDAKPKGVMAKIFDGVTGKHFGIPAERKVIVGRIKETYKPFLAQDITLDDSEIEKIMERLQPAEASEESKDESVSEAQHNAMEAAANGNSELDIPKKVGEEFADKDKKAGFDEEGFKGFLAGKGLGEDDINTAMGMLPKPNALDEFPDKEKDDDEEKAKDADPDKDEEKDKMAAKDSEAKKPDAAVTPAAMDQAIKAASDSTRKEVLATQRGIREAEKAVAPYVGALDMAFDSAEEVYREALTMLGVENVKDIHPSAYKQLLSMQPKAGAKRAVEGGMGMDSKSVSDFNTRFPDAARIGQA